MTGRRVRRTSALQPRTTLEVLGRKSKQATTTVNGYATRFRRASFAEIVQEIGREFDGDGDATVSLGTDTVTLHPPSTVDASIEASAPEGDREDDANESLTISARWPTTRTTDGDE